MNLIIMGLPGSGKGTQSDFIVDKYQVKHLSTGNLFRQEIASGSELGLELKSYMDKGELVPDELTIRLLKEEISKSDYNNGFLLDGFPRTLVQAQALSEMLNAINKQIDHVVYLDLDESVIMERLTGRLFCPTCQKTYHKTLNAPKAEGVCDDDQTPLMVRDDDQPDKVRNRLDIANKEMQPMLDYYQAQGNLDVLEILESDNPEAVFKKICEVLG